MQQRRRPDAAGPDRHPADGDAAGKRGDELAWGLGEVDAAKDQALPDDGRPRLRGHGEEGPRARRLWVDEGPDAERTEERQARQSAAGPLVDGGQSGGQRKREDRAFDERVLDEHDECVRHDPLRSAGAEE